MSITRTGPRAVLLGMALAGLAACGEHSSSPAGIETLDPAFNVLPGPCPTSPDPADTSCLHGPVIAASTDAALESAPAAAGNGYNIAYIDSNPFNHTGVSIVVTARGLGTVTPLTVQDVVNGALRSGGYDVIFFGRHFIGFGGNPFTMLPDALRDELDLALQNGSGLITEWQGGSVVWSAIAKDDFNYFQFTDPNGNPWNWFQGTVDRGDDGWAHRFFTTIDPLHPVTQGMSLVFAPVEITFCYRLANVGPSIHVVATLTDYNNVEWPAISVGERHGSRVVLWTCDWGDNFGGDPSVANWIENAIRYAATSDEVIEVAIDIKPGSNPNSIHRNSMGVVPVAILGSAAFDVTTVDVTTLTFGPAGATPAHDLTDPATYAGHLQDVNGDGFMDLVSHYAQKLLGLVPADVEACLSGATTAGTPIQGCDAVRVIGG